MRKGGLLLKTWSHSFSQSDLDRTSVMAVDRRAHACTSIPPGPARAHSITSHTNSASKDWTPRQPGQCSVVQAGVTGADVMGEPCGEQSRTTCPVFIFSSGSHTCHRSYSALITLMVLRIQEATCCTRHHNATKSYAGVRRVTQQVCVERGTGSQDTVDERHSL